MRAKQTTGWPFFADPDKHNALIVGKSGAGKSRVLGDIAQKAMQQQPPSPKADRYNTLFLANPLDRGSVFKK